MHASIDNMTTGPSNPGRPTNAGRYRWRVVDIITAAVLGVASGVIFWVWGLAWTPLSALLAFTPGLEGLLAGGWLFAGVLGALVIRKPGAAIFTELVAGFVEMAIGSSWGASNLVWALIEGFGAELAFLIVLYRSWRFGIVLVSGALAGLSTGLLDTNFSSMAGLAAGPKLIYVGSAVLSGVVLAGVLAWLVVRGLARTGALSRFASGRQTRIVERGRDDAAGESAPIPSGDSR